MDPGLGVVLTAAVVLDDVLLGERYFRHRLPAAVLAVIGVTTIAI